MSNEPVTSRTFDYDGTPKDFANWISKWAEVDWQALSDGKGGIPDLGLPTITRLRDGTPYLVEFSGVEDVAVPGEDTPARQPFAGMSFRLKTIPYSRTRVTAECWHRIFEEDFRRILSMLGVGVESEIIDPWEKIPDHRWDRKALRLWREGLSAPEIASKLRNEGELTAKSIHNRLSILRGQYGEKTVPKAKDRK